MNRIPGKTCVTTGAAFGIGRATAVRFSQEGARPSSPTFRRRRCWTWPTSYATAARQKRQATYGPAKFVASGITRYLAVEWADRGIRVNAVAPGTIRTERVMRLPAEPGSVEYLQSIERMHPMGRIGEPSEVAAAIHFLASDDAAFINGVVLPVDGGYLAQ